MSDSRHVEKMRFFVVQLRNAVITYPKCAFNAQFSKEIDQLNKEVSECLNTGKNRNSRRPAVSGVVTAFTPDPSVLGIVGLKNSLKSRWRSY